MLRAVSISAAVQSGVPERIANNRYSSYSSKILSNAAPRLIQAERWVNASSTSQANPCDSSSRMLFLRYAERAIRQTVNTMTGSDFLRFDRGDRITSFRSIINVQPDGWLHVCEVIRIYNGDGEQKDEHGQRIKVDNQIQRGIERDFPTKYIEPNGFLKKVPFILDSVTMNGSPELFQQVSAPNGVVVRIGNPMVYLDEGEYEYKLWYRTAEQLYHGDTYDEVYWNATGNGWRLSIDYAECVVNIPTGAVITSLRGFTGYAGDTALHCITVAETPNRAVCSTTVPLDSAQGMTISVRCSRGGFIQPDTTARWWDFLQDNLILPVFVFGFLVMSVLNYVLWYRHGRDPVGGTIHPAFEPPKGLSPAEVG
ncbi:MAG: DUF2207 domain-containing protein, partial [Candidatus Kapabacteria bacterium]|nr:DUF2207 domain-containing protein [Candidatus Kapabacteria bacterium]